jgi:hypothetical protein
MRRVGVALQVLGFVLAALALTAGLAGAAYLEGHALLMLLHQQVTAKEEKFERVFLLPLCALFGGGIAALPGVGLLYLGTRLRGRSPRGEAPRRGLRRVLGPLGGPGPTTRT